MLSTEQAAANFATCRNLAALFRRHNVPRRFIGRYERRARYWRKQFAFAYANEIGRSLFLDEVDAGLFIFVGHATP